ncbi:MAG TPA: C-GCAxxG-C-C family protein [bacterium]|nr:C-GCAxxG-C-C family protein [bacterium]
MGDEVDGVEALAARAVTLFNRDYNCAEAVTVAVGSYFEPEQRCFPRVATCFGGGVGRRGEICGALAGAVMVVGFLKGRRPGEGPEAKERAYQLAEQVVEAFRHRFGNVSCRALIGIDLSGPNGQETYRRKDVHKIFCAEYVAEAARLAHDAINP